MRININQRNIFVLKMIHIFNISYFQPKKIFNTPPPLNTFNLSIYEKYFIFKEHIPEEQFLKFKDNFIQQSCNRLNIEPKIDILIILNMIKECNDTELKRLIKEFAIICYNNKLINITDKEKKLQLKEYETTIDKITLKEFQIEFKTNCLTKEEEKYFSGIHQIILFSYFKIEEFEKFKKYYFEHENEFKIELRSLYDYLDFFNSEIIISLIKKNFQN